MTYNSSPQYAVTWERLSEFVGDFIPRRREFGSHFQLLRGARNEKALTSTINRQLTTLYNQEATAFSRSLGGGDFKLDAAWKQRELQRESRVMAKSLRRTFSKERDRIAKLPFAERKAARAKFVEFKDKQLDLLVRKEANFAAQTDIMAHSGSESQKLVDVSKSKVMYFQNLGDRTCDFCIGIASGNPYSIQQSTTLGSSAHPSCVCEWTQEWHVDPDVLRNAKRQVEDGEVRIWNGSARTPVGGKALTKVKKMQVRKGGWRGRRIEQKKVIFQKTGQKVKQPYAADRVFPGGGIETVTVRPAAAPISTPAELSPVPTAPPGFKTAEEAQAWARGRHPHVDWQLDKAAPEVASAIVRQLDSLAREYPEVFSHTRSVAVGRITFGKKTWAGARKSYALAYDKVNEGGISFAPKWAGNYESFVSALRSTVQKGWCHKECNTIESIVSHEFGHLLHARLQATDAAGGSKAIRQMVFDWKNKFRGRRGEVSLYAKTNVKEFFAESFSVMRHAPEASWPEPVRALSELLGGLSL